MKKNLIVWDLLDVTRLTLLIQKQSMQPEKNFFLLNKILRGYLFFKITTYWIDLKKPRLTCEIHDPSYETMITL